MLVLALRKNMKCNEIIEGVAGPKNCWPGYRKTGTQPGTGKNKGKRVNDCEKIEEDEVTEGVMSEIDLEVGEMMDKYIERFHNGEMDGDHLMHMMDKASGILARRYDMEQEEALQFISNYVEQSDNQEKMVDEIGGEAEIVKSDDSGITYKDSATGVVTTLPPTMAGALAPNPQNPNQFTLNPQAVTPTDNQGKPKGPPVGAKVSIAPMSEVRQSRSVPSSNVDLDAMLRIAGLK